MKKFLFTLAMLLMAGSAFADNYLYMDDIVLTKNFVEQSSKTDRRINVPVKAHFEQWTNAFDVTFDYGDITCLGAAVDDGGNIIAPDMVLQGMNKAGTMVNTTVALNSNADANHFIAANSVGGYYYPEGSNPDEDDPVQYGAVKWAPGNYECMFMLLLQIPKNFEGGDITVSSKFASGGDSRPNVETIPAEYAEIPTVKVAHVSVIDNTPAISDDGEKVTAVFNGATTNVELYLKNGEEWVKVDNPYTLPEATDVDQVLVFKAKTVPAEGAEGQLPAESEEYTVTIKAATPELQPAPEPTITDDGTKVTAAIAGDTQHTYVLELWNAETETWGEVDNPYTLPAQTYEVQTLKFRAYTKAIEDVDSEDSEYCAEYTVTIPAKEKDYAPTPKINNDGTVVTAAVENDDPEAPHTVVLEYWNAETEEWVVVEDGSYELPEPTFETQTIKFRAYTKKNGEYFDSPYCDEVTVTIDPKDSNKAPAPKFRVEDGKLYAYSEQDLEVVLKLDGEVVPNGYPLPTENTSYTDPIVLNFTAYAKADGVTYNIDSDEASYPFTLDPLTKKTAQKPTIAGANLTNTTYDIVITPDANTDGTLQYTVDEEGTVVRAGATTIRYERKDADYYVAVTAKTLEGPTYKASELAEASIKIPAKDAPKVYEVPDPTISVDNSDPTKTVITIEATEGVLSYTLTEDGKPFTDYTVEVVDGKTVITIENGEEVKTVEVTATTTLTSVPEGYDSVENGSAEQTVQTPVYVQPQTEMPTIDVSFGGDTGSHYALVTFANNDDAPVVIQYCIGYPENEDDWITYTGAPVTISTYGTYVIYARAKAEGKTWSVVNERSFTLDDDATSVNELVNGKTVAGVRYFNMAGQEMQEANGITIVVTTYTDGTTSAVKVIK